MEYEALEQESHHHHHHGGPSKNPQNPQNPPNPQNHPSGLGRMVQSITRRNLAASYEKVDSDSDDDDDTAMPSPSTTAYAPAASPAPLRPTGLRVQTAAAATAASTATLSPLEPLLRSASGRSPILRHPTPDLQTLQGAYTGNIKHLERTAEQLSMTSSSIDHAIRELHTEQKRNDQCRSATASVSRQVSNASSIVETNSRARAGGYSPAGFIMSPQGSFTTQASLTHSSSVHGRAASSKSARFGARPEPELEGRPLDAYVSPPSGMSPATAASRSASMAADDNAAAAALKTITLPPMDPVESQTLEVRNPGERDGHGEQEDRPTTSATVNSVDRDRAQMAFADFDGVHSAPQRGAIAGTGLVDAIDLSLQRLSLGTLPVVDEDDTDNQHIEHIQHIMPPPVASSVAGSDANQRRVSSGDQLSKARPQSYVDQQTGQQMVFYPAPVPRMLNLPPKLSKAPSSMARSKRRSQVLSNIPPTARQSAIWLPDVLETEDEPDLPETDEAQNLEYVPQHQRMSMGGRRAPQDLQHLPPQLRASAFFDLPAPEMPVELKEQSPVATLESILDASAYAPVGAFTDHQFAGQLGAEVYGKPKNANTKSANRKSTTNLLAPEEKVKKRTSTFNLLGRRSSSSDPQTIENERRRATIEDIRAGKIIREEDEEEEQQSEEGDAEEEQEQEYHGAPTTLLAELQLRKQQQKQRTRPLTTAYPNGLHSTLLQLDAVAQVEQNSRKQKRVTLAWEGPSEDPNDPVNDDEDVPLAYLYAKRAQARNFDRPLGLMERRDIEDNEPLSRRRERLLQAKYGNGNRMSTMTNMVPMLDEDDENETLAQRRARLRGEPVPGLPKARPVSVDFASEMMSQFGGDVLEPKPEPKAPGKESPVSEDDETLGQRRRRLLAEAAARAKEVGAPADASHRPAPAKRHSMADILHTHPAAGIPRPGAFARPAPGLLGQHERATAQRSSTLFNPAGNFRGGAAYGNTMARQPQWQAPAFPQPTLGFAGPRYGPNMMFANPYAAYQQGGGAYLPQTQVQMQLRNQMQIQMQMQNQMQNQMLQMGAQPLNQGQIDMVERWRQSVMQ